MSLKTLRMLPFKYNFLYGEIILTNDHISAPKCLLYLLVFDTLCLYRVLKVYYH